MNLIIAEREGLRRSQRGFRREVEPLFRVRGDGGVFEKSYFQLPTEQSIQFLTDCSIQFSTEYPIQFTTACPIQFTTACPIQLTSDCPIQFTTEWGFIEKTQNAPPPMKNVVPLHREKEKTP